MDPLLQWILTIIGFLIGTAIVASAKFLYGMDKKLGQIDQKVALFMQSAEMRFEDHERRIRDIGHRMDEMDEK